MLATILDDLSAYMQDEEQIIEVLALAPRFREGIHLLATGVLSSHEGIALKTVELLAKLQSSKLGQEAFSNLNFIIQQAYFKKMAVLIPPEI